MRPALAQLVLAVAPIALAGCACFVQVDDDIEPRAEMPQLEPYTESISGSTVDFDMVPVNASGHPSFWIGKTEVTWDMYDVFVYERDKKAGGGSGPDGALTEADAVSRPSRPYVPPDLGYGYEGYAAISLSYLGAEHFCKWISAKTGRTYRLPTEAEWKLVCEQSGITAENADDYAWHDENADFTPHPVASKQVDATGLYDLWGNVREWCTGDDGNPVAMGGSFMDLPDEIGCAARHVPTPDWQMTDPQVPKSKWWLSDAPFAGFRIVCEPAPQQGQER